MYCMSQKHRTFIVTLMKYEFLVQIIVSILFAGSYILMHAKFVTVLLVVRCWHIAVFVGKLVVL